MLLRERKSKARPLQLTSRHRSGHVHAHSGDEREHVSRTSSLSSDHVYGYRPRGQGSWVAHVGAPTSRTPVRPVMCHLTAHPPPTPLGSPRCACHTSSLRPTSNDNRPIYGSRDLSGKFIKWFVVYFSRRMSCRKIYDRESWNNAIRMSSSTRVDMSCLFGIIECCVKSAAENKQDSMDIIVGTNVDIIRSLRSF